jgi:hypothetical protein
MARKRYVVRNTMPDKYDVVAIGPYVVSAGLKQIEAEALAKALNEESKTRVDNN